MNRQQRGGGWAAIWYTLRMARKVGVRQLWRAMTTRNTCKTCALGMGGQSGGMRNESGHWPEVCKKSLQAMVADMQKGIRPEFFRKYSIAQLQTLSPRELEWCGRLTVPMFAGPGDSHYRPLSWEEALSKVANKLKATNPEETFFYASGRSSNEAGFLLQLFARLYGTNYVNNCSYYCHQASGVGLTASVGTGTATVTLQDVENADLFFLIGGNPASNHPRLMRTLMNIRRKGGKIVVINPVKEVGLVNFSVPSDVWSLLFGSKIADEYVQPHIGGDMALLTGMAKIVLQRNGHNREFLNTATEGFEDFVQHVDGISWDTIQAGSGVNRQTITRLAEHYLQANNVIFSWTMGITHHQHGTENVRSIVNLALLRGMVGRPNAGLLPIRGHSNVQGVGSVGVTPNLKKAILDNLESLLDVKLPTAPGYDTMMCMQAADRGEMRTALCLGGNLLGSNPDTRFAQQALSKLDLITYFSTTLNTGHVFGRGQETLILPVLARDEEPQPTTQESMFNFVRLSDGGVSRQPEARSEVDLIATLGTILFPDAKPVDWAALKNTCSVQQMIARTVPGFDKLEAIAQTKEEFTIGGRHINKPSFPTPSGKAQFAIQPLPELATAEGQLRLMTVRSEGQFNTVVYEEEDIYRGQDRRDVILMNRDDIKRLQLQVNQRVTVTSSVGALSNILVREYDIKAGNALMYFPEANVLVPTTTDPKSKTPAFKCVLVRVSPTTSDLTNGQIVTQADGRRSLEVIGDRS